MATKLINLKIEHVAGVDRPANKRKFLIVKSQIEKQLHIVKEGEKYCVYDGEKKVGSYDSREAAQAAMNMKKGATMLTAQQIAAIKDKDAQEAAVKQQEEYVELEKKNKALEDEVATLKGRPPAKDDDESIWKGVPPAIRHRFESMQKERDDSIKKAKEEKDERENAHWAQKCQGFKYLQITPQHFGRVMKSVAEKCDQGEADEIMRVLGLAEQAIDKGVLFAELGKNHGSSSRGDASNIVDRVNHLAADYQKMDVKLTKDQAISKVFTDHPDWYGPYRQASTIGVSAS
jgi:hypothetical protein